VLDDDITLCDLARCNTTSAFLDSLSIILQPRDNLLALYQGWINCLHAFQAAKITGRFVLAPNSEAEAVRREALVEYDRLVRQISNLRAQAENELQINRRVELNLEIKRLTSVLARVRAKL